MQYIDFKGKKLSALGFGCMRFPTLNDDNGCIDEEATRAMVQRAIAGGVNYFDTAWVYHKGNSERVISNILKEYPRQSYYLATKLSAFEDEVCRNVSKYFEKQLATCGTDYFDFYLLHCVQESNIDRYLNEEYGVIPYLKAQKAAGRIKHLGFSCHCSLQTFERMLDACGEDIEFCQIELNWYDWSYQRASEKVAMLKQRGIPIWVMEPLRGGKLVEISPQDTKTLKALRPNEGIPAWGFRFLQRLQVDMILSGMSTMAQVEDNLKTFETDAPLNDNECQTLLAIADKMIASGSVPCSACRYCVADCPMNLDIPTLIKHYNEHVLTNEELLPADALTEQQTPANCSGCQSCEKLCPQGIKIHKVMEDFAAALEETT